MKKVLISSKNPAKIAAVEQAFRQAFPTKCFEFVGMACDSGVSPQPMTEAETYLGASTRLLNAQEKAQQAHLAADYIVAIEAGLDKDLTFAWILITNGSIIGKARSASLALPSEVLAQLKPTNELGTVLDEKYGTKHIKQKGGAIGLLTHNALSRAEVYVQALILALIPFINPETKFN